MKTMTFGNVDVTRIEEMHGPVGVTPEQFVPDMPKAVWDTHQDMLVPDHWNSREDLVQVAMQPWLLRSDGKTILIDTGVGNHKSRPAVDAWNQLDSDLFLSNLAAAGVQPDDVDIVVNTHLHVDHVGWNTSLHEGEWVTTFPNATYLMHAADFDFWHPENHPSLIGGVNENVFEDSVQPVHDSGQVKLWSSEYVIDGALRLEEAPGHTPGSSVVRLESADDRAFFVGDLLHSPTQIVEPDYNSCFCEDPAAARATRYRWLGEAADRSALVIPAHFAGHGAATVSRHEGAFAIHTWAAFERL